MSRLLKTISLFSLSAAVMVLTGCEVDGRSASDNPNAAPQIISNGGPGGGGAVTPLLEAGVPLAIDSSDAGDVESAKAVIDSNGNITVVWTQSDGIRINLWAIRYTAGSAVGSGWGNAQLLENSAGVLDDVKAFQVVVDTTGNVTVVWTQGALDSYTDLVTTLSVNVERTDLWANRYSTTLKTWGTAEKIESSDLTAQATENIEDIGEFQLVVDGTTLVGVDGVVSVLWTQHSGSLYDLYATRNVAGTWDASPTLVDTDPVEKDLGDVASPQLLVDGANLFALWTQSDGVRFNLWGARYAAGWSLTTKIDSEDQGNVEAPKAIVDGSGNAIVAWRQFNSVDNAFNLWTARYSVSIPGWEAATQAEMAASDVSEPQLLVYGTAEAMLLWVQSDGTVNNIWSNHYDGGWGAAGTITNGTGDAGSVVMVSDSGGNVTAAWVQHDGVAALDNLWANRFSGGAWGSAGLLETQSGGDVRSPMLLVDGSGRVSAIWLQSEGGFFDLWSNHYISGAWGSAGLVEGIDGGSAVDPHAIMSGSGNISLVWRQSYGTGNPLVTSNYTAGTASAWGSVATIAPQDYDNGYSPQLLVDSTGIVTVIWLQPVVVGQTQTLRIDLWADRF